MDTITRISLTIILAAGLAMLLSRQALLAGVEGCYLQGVSVSGETQNCTSQDPYGNGVICGSGYVIQSYNTCGAGSTMSWCDTDNEEVGYTYECNPNEDNTACQTVTGSLTPIYRDVLYLDIPC
jgi:hypothetical protein